jgi:23S rRNA pseudouridine2605 synthase
MAKDNKRPPSKGKKKFGDKKERSPKEEGTAFKRTKRESSSEDDYFDRRESREKKSTSESRPSFKKDKEVSFKRYRDNARPSDFSTSRKRDVDEKERSYKTDDRKERSRKDGEYGGFKKENDKRGSAKKHKSFGDKPFSKKSKEVNPYDLDEQDFNYGKEEPNYSEKKRPAYTKKPYVKKEFNPVKKSEPQRSREDDGTIRLNKYISNAGICSRREADELIESGVVQVNGKTITEMGYRIKPTDIVKYGGQTLKKEKMIYLVLNKPKDYITTIDDPQKRRTVLELVQNACKERIYPVGRLDRSTTGLLMFTNDGELTKKLTHPRYGVRKIYHVELDKPLKKQDLDQIAEGLELEDGQIKVDEVSYVGDGKDKAQIGIELHSGKNRIVRRIFEHLGYNVRKLDRVMFGSLTKKELARGRWRFLTDAEVGILKMISEDK